MDVLEIMYLRALSAIQAEIDAASIRAVKSSGSGRGLNRAERKMYKGKISGLRTAQHALRATYLRYVRELRNADNY